MNTYKINSHVNTGITLFDLFAAQTYRTPKIVTEIHVFKDNYFFPVCPRCKITIEREYQTQINTIYQDPLTAKLISLGEQSPTGQIQRFDGDWCWWQYARYMTPKSEVSAVLDAKLTPAKENTIDGNDIQKFKACLESALTASSYKTKIDDALKTCKSCKESASLYNTVNNYISELSKCE